MSKRDRSVLGGLVLAMIVGVGGSLGLAASCLGRDGAHRADDPLTSFPEDRSARTSSGGVAGEENVGTTETTSVELPAGAPTAPPAPANAPPPNMNPTAAPAQVPPAAPRPPPPAPAAATANTTVNVHVNGEQVSTSTGAADGGQAMSAPAAPQESASDGGATSTTTREAGATTPAPTATITQRFSTDSPPYGASSWSANHEAGAGPFTTERNVPDRPGP